MKRKKPTTPPTQESPQRYTRKQALGILHRLYREKYVPLAEFDKQFSQEVQGAFSVLARAIHGEPTGPRYSMTLCDRCHERYYQHWVDIAPNASFPDITHILFCCAACKNTLLAEGKAIAVDGLPVTTQRSEDQHDTAAE